MRHLIDEFGDVEKAIAAYNTGPGNVKKHAWSTIMSDRYARMKNGKGQTFHYVKGVSRYMQAYNGGKDQAYTANEVAEQAANYAKQQADLAKKQEKARERIEYELLNAQARAKADHDKRIKELMEAGFEPG